VRAPGVGRPARAARSTLLLSLFAAATAVGLSWHARTIRERDRGVWFESACRSGQTVNCAARVGDNKYIASTGSRAPRLS